MGTSKWASEKLVRNYIFPDNRPLIPVDDGERTGDSKTAWQKYSSSLNFRTADAIRKFNKYCPDMFEYEFTLGC